MAAEAIEELAEVSSAPPATKRRAVLMLALGGIIVGGAVGALALGPQVAKRLAARPAKAALNPAKTGVPAVYEVSNLVLNPAGTGGSRFLMVTATFQVKDDGTKQLLKDRDSEVRDRILSVLGRKVIDQLTDMTHRDAIKRELIDSVGAMFPKGTIVSLYFPQFVIQ